MKKTIVLASLIFVLFSSFVKTEVKPEKFCGPTFKITNNHSGMTITGYQIWEYTNGTTVTASGLSITNGNSVTTGALGYTGTTVVRVFFSAGASAGSLYAWNDMPGEYGCADLILGAPRSTVMLDISTCDEIQVSLRSTSCY